MPSPQHSHEELHELARIAGVSTEYYDIAGNLNRPSDETLTSVLASMGYGDVRSSLQELKGRPFNQLMEPVLAAHEDEQPLKIDIHFPCEASEENNVIINIALYNEDGNKLSHTEFRGIEVIDEILISGKRHVKTQIDNKHREWGYYRFNVSVSVNGHIMEGNMLLIVAPRRCWLPEHRTWGLTLSLYSLRSGDDVGAGDLDGLRDMMKLMRSLGAGFVGISPLHSIGNSFPESISPYQPISRLYMNPLYADTRGAKAGNPKELVDYDKAFALKDAALRENFEKFYPDAQDNKDFNEYCANEGRDLELYATFMALNGHLSKEGHSGTYLQGWQTWPKEYHDPEGKAVRDFSASNQKEITFHKYTQWVMHKQLMELQGMMSVGLYLDLAVGSIAGGSDAWTFREAFATGTDMGAPPDDFSPSGQNWQFPPLSPVRLRQSGYEMFIAMLRKSMRYSGALRIDHALGLFRTFWIPQGMDASEGTYVTFPAQEMLKIISLESQRNKTMVIAEDLGTIMEGVHEALEAHGMLSYRLLYFQRDWNRGTFLPPEAYPWLAFSAINTHDLPTLKGFFASNDIEARQALRQYKSDEKYTEALNGRQWEVCALKEALAPYINESDGVEAEMLAAHRFIAHTPSLLAAVSLDDALGSEAQQNLPGITEGHPNWRKRYTNTVEEIRETKAGQRLMAIAEIFSQARQQAD